MAGAYVYIGKVQIRIEPIKIGEKSIEDPWGPLFLPKNRSPKVEGVKNEKFGKAIKYEYYLEVESANNEKVDKALKQDAYSEKFMNYLRDKIAEHQNDTDYEVAYVFVKGFGNSYPYIRASRFMSNFEKHIKGFKLIMFYPGVAKGYYSLFGILQDENLYRAIKLINE